MAEILECLSFDLANSLTGHTEFFSDFSRVYRLCCHAETHAQDSRHIASASASLLDVIADDHLVHAILDD
jgi:hypothetical protein